jgi:hypothetical protein
VSRAGGGLKSFVDGLRAEGDFGFVFGSVRQRFNPGASTEFAYGHAEGAIDFFGRDDAGTKGQAGPGDERGGLRMGRGLAQTVIRLFIGDEHGL